MRRCHYVARAGENGRRATDGLENPERVYLAEEAAQRAADSRPGSPLTTGMLNDIPDWATEVETRDGSVVCPQAVPHEGTPVYAMRSRPAVQFGTLPPGVELLHWTAVPVDLSHRFPGHTVSRRPFGEFVANRELSDDELESYQIEQVR